MNLKTRLENLKTPDDLKSLFVDELNFEPLSDPLTGMLTPMLRDQIESARAIAGQSEFKVIHCVLKRLLKAVERQVSEQFAKIQETCNSLIVFTDPEFKWLNRYKGVFISDVVGLGKTYIGAGLLKQLNRRSLVISPPGLIPMWEQFIEKFEVDAKVVSRGKLRNGVFNKASELWPYQEREIVLIDESHHFRNENTKCYHELQPFLANKRAILMTATPQNTSAWNIYHQMKLFHQSEENISPTGMKSPTCEISSRKSIPENHVYRIC